MLRKQFPKHIYFHVIQKWSYLENIQFSKDVSLPPFFNYMMSHNSYNMSNESPKGRQCCTPLLNLFNHRIFPPLGIQECILYELFS